MNTCLRTWRRTGAVAAVLALTVAATGGCSAAKPGDKAGGSVTLVRLASIDEVNDNGLAYGPEEFVAALAAVSGGRFKVEVKTGYGDGAADAESALVASIAAGDLDGGWPSVRAFAAADIPGLEAVEAPLTIVSYAAEKELVSGDVASEVLNRLDGSGVRGVGLAVGPLRRVMATDAPLLRLADWQHQTVRTYHSPTQAATIEALGAEPVDVGFGALTDEVVSGRLRAVEADIAQMASNGNPRLANVTTNVVLWPKVFVLSVSDQFYDGLDDEQRGWLEEAAARATQASLDATYDESEAASQLCESGWRFHQASQTDLAELRRAVQPVLDELAAGSADGGLLARVQAIAAKHPDPEPLDLDPVCVTDVSRDTTVGLIPTTTSGLPAGAYRVEISDADLARSELTGTAGLTGTWTLLVRDGTFQLSCQPLDNPGTDCAHEVYDGPLEAGDLRGAGQDVYFVHNPQRLAELTGCTLPVSQSRAGACFAGQHYKMTWALDGDELTFSDFVSDWPDPQYLVEPWTKIS